MPHAKPRAPVDPTAAQLEVAILDRARPRRKFRRIRGDALATILAAGD